MTKSVTSKPVAHTTVPRTTTRPETPVAKASKAGRTEKASDNFVTTKAKKAEKESVGLNPGATAAMRLALSAATTAIANGAFQGGDSKKIAGEALKELSSPEYKTVVGAALPKIVEMTTAVGGQQAAEIIKRNGENLAANGGVKFLLGLGKEAGGVDGQRLVGAAMRGWANSGGNIEQVVAEIAKTGAKVGSGHAGKAGKADLAEYLGRAAPVVGDVEAMKALAFALKTAVQVTVPKKLVDEEGNKVLDEQGKQVKLHTDRGTKVAAWTAVACAIGGLALNVVGNAA